MITDEQIEELDTCGWEWSCIDKDEKYAFARKIIALAQQVKPLQFERDEDGDLVAKSPMGNFHVLIMVLSGFVYNGKPYKTEAEAIAAANEDYQRRVLSCLVWGGV